MNGIVKPLKKNMANKADGSSTSLGSSLKIKFKNTFQRTLNTSGVTTSIPAGKLQAKKMVLEEDLSGIETMDQALADI